MTAAAVLIPMVGLLLTVLAFFFVLEWRLGGLESALKMVAWIVGGMLSMAVLLAFWFWVGSVVA